MIALIQREPAVIAGLVAALIALAVAFGFQLNGGQTGAIMAVVSALTAVVVRAQVTPTSSLPPVGTIVPGVIPPVIPHG